MHKRTSWATLILAVLVSAGMASAQAQTPPPPKPAEQQKPKPPAKKAKKVWTEDDISDVRKPWDDHADKTQASEESAKAKEAKAKEAKPGEAKPAGEEAEQAAIDPKTGKPYEDPDSVEAMEKQVQNLEQEIKRTEDLAEEARKEMASTTNQDRWELAKSKLETYEANIEDMKKKSADLNARIAEKKKGQPAAKPAAPAPPQS